MPSYGGTKSVDWRLAKQEGSSATTKARQLEGNRKEDYRMEKKKKKKKKKGYKIQTIALFKWSTSVGFSDIYCSDTNCLENVLTAKMIDDPWRLSLSIDLLKGDIFLNMAVFIICNQ